jgi:glutamate:Na+ symporter, ESS family
VAIPTLGIVQALLGFGLVALWWAARSEMLHPGFGWMLTLGFQQGPGQALAFGRAWETQGLVDGGQIGLLFAAIGFLYCGLLGVPLVAYARRRGWIEATPDEDALPGGAAVPDRTSRRADLEPLSTQVLLIAVVYAGVFGVLWVASAPLPDGSPLRATVWGFHFIVGAGLAIALRRGARRSRRDALFDDDLLARISVIAVDITTAGAIAAVKLEVLADWLLPVFVFTACGGALTLLTAMWLARRAFPEAPFAHALVLFGMSTGTVSTGLALLRMLDPELKGPVARNVVVAATASVPLYAPLFLAIIPFSVTLWSRGLAAAIGWPIGVLFVYLVVLAVAWRRLTPFRWARPGWRLWPPPDRP